MKRSMLSGLIMGVPGATSKTGNRRDLLRFITGGFNPRRTSSETTFPNPWPEDCDICNAA